MSSYDQSIARCDPQKIIPIYPCRYVISDEILLTDSKALPPVLTPPTGVDQAPHHQLASLRQGYVYIYGNLSINGSNVTDNKACWLIFRYQTRADDCNSPDETTACAGTFQFYKYTWKNGTPRSDWEADWQTYPYAFVNSCAINTYIAYSEERWPAYMFEVLERDESWRHKVMQPLDLHGNDPHLMKIDQLIHRIEDFKDNECADRETNAVRHTPIGQIDSEPFERMQATHPERFESARIVALEDTLGEAKDLLRLAEVVEANIQAEETKYHYAMTTAKAIAAVPNFESEVHSRHIDPGIQLWNNVTYAARKLFSSDPFNRAADTKRKELAEYGPRQRKETEKAIIELWAALDQRPRWHEETRLALQGAEQLGCEKCIGFIASQLGHYVSGVKLNSQAPAYVYDKLTIDKIEDGSQDDSDWAKLVGAFVKAASKIVDKLGDPWVLERVHQLFFEIYTEVATTLHKGNSRIDLHRIEILAGVVERRQIIPTSDLSTVTNQHYERLLNARASNILEQYSTQNARITHNTSQYATIEYIAYEHLKDSTLGKASFGLSGISMVLAVLGAEKTISQWHRTHKFDARSKAGAIANLPAVELGLALSTVVASATAIYASPTYIRLASNTSLLAQRLSSHLLGWTGYTVITPERPTIGVSSAQLQRRALVAKAFGGVALATGLLLSIGLGVEGYKREDYAFMTGHGLQGIGGLMMSASLIGGVLKGSSILAVAAVGSGLVTLAIPLAIIGGVLLAFGLLFVSVSRSELEMWVYEGFWGRSTQYWGKERYIDFLEQLSESENLIATEEINTAIRTDKFEKFFNREMRAFEQIIWHIEVEQSQTRDGRLFIKFSGLTNHDQVRQLSIKVERSQGLLLSAWEDTSGLGVGRPTADWISPGIAVTNLSLYRGQANLRVDISYERMLPDGSQQRFNMIEPYVIDNPSQL